MWRRGRLHDSRRGGGATLKARLDERLFLALSSEPERLRPLLGLRSSGRTPQRIYKLLDLTPLTLDFLRRFL